VPLRRHRGSVFSLSACVVPCLCACWLAPAPPAVAAAASRFPASLFPELSWSCCVLLCSDRRDRGDAAAGRDCGAGAAGAHRARYILISLFRSTQLLFCLAHADLLPLPLPQLRSRPSRRWPTARLHRACTATCSRGKELH
jgi:hypothetical protein